MRPDELGGLILSDDVVTGWWEQRGEPDSQFALVHQLAPDEVERITAPRYTSHFHGLSLTGGEFIREEVVTGDRLRDLAAHAAVSPSSSAHLELPSGIVTLHSDLVGDVFFLPAGTGSWLQPSSRADRWGTPRPGERHAARETVSWFGADEPCPPETSAVVDEEDPDHGSPSNPPALPRRTVAGRLSRLARLWF
ncbi:hypothetical protein [Streptomyces chartreusis]